MKIKIAVRAVMALSLATGGLALGADRNDARQPARQDEQRDQRGAGPNHDWHRGDRLPPEYHNRQYVVDDWHSHNLSAPPRGYHWVQNGGDYVLVAIATGVIAQILLGR